VIRSALLWITVHLLSTQPPCLQIENQCGIATKSVNSLIKLADSDLPIQCGAEMRPLMVSPSRGHQTQDLVLILDLQVPDPHCASCHGSFVEKVQLRTVQRSHMRHSSFHRWRIRPTTPETFIRHPVLSMTIYILARGTFCVCGSMILLESITNNLFS
jgi:hypothetical protein